MRATTMVAIESLLPFPRRWRSGLSSLASPSRYGEPVTILGDLRTGGRFLWEVPRLVRHPLTYEEARATLRRRLEHRELDFLALAKHAIYEYRSSPYRALLRVAGCEYGDLARLVGRDGVE